MPDINRLQPFQRASKIYQAIFASENGQLDTRQTSIDDLLAQIIVDTATWALAIYEKELGITTDLSQTYDERRAVIKSKMRGTGTVDAALIKVVADSYTNGDVVVSFADSTITVTYTSVVGVPPNETSLEAAIEEIKPAHLAILYKYRYNKWSEVATKTWADIAAFTWEQVMSDGAVVF
jgi:uncharacterized protein YmfQ (DUF2313 family)